MAPLRGTFESVEKYLPHADDQEKVVENERLKDLKGEDYSQRLEFWQDRIRKTLEREFEKDYVVTNMEDKVQHMGNRSGTFFVVDLSSPLLNRGLGQSLRESNFEEFRGSKNVVFSKAFERAGLQR